MWLFVKYVKYVIFFAVLWIILWLQSNFRIWRAPRTIDYMSPVVAPDSFVIYNPKVRDIRDFRPKDIIIYDQMEGPTTKTYIGRVIAKEGHAVSIRSGEVYVDNEFFSEEYLTEKCDPDERFEEIRIPKDHIFVLADRRSRKEDSRKFGPIHVSCVKGRRN